MATNTTTVWQFKLPRFFMIVFGNTVALNLKTFSSPALPQQTIEENVERIGPKHKYQWVCLHAYAARSCRHCRLVVHSAHAYIIDCLADILIVFSVSNSHNIFWLVFRVRGDIQDFQVRNVRCSVRRKGCVHVHISNYHIHILLRTELFARS